MIVASATQCDNVVDLHQMMEIATGSTIVSRADDLDICDRQFANGSHPGATIQCPGPLDGSIPFGVCNFPAIKKFLIAVCVLFSPDLGSGFSLRSIRRISVTALVNFCGELGIVFHVLLISALAVAWIARSPFSIVFTLLLTMFAAPLCLPRLISIRVFYGPISRSLASRVHKFIVMAQRFVAPLCGRCVAGRTGSVDHPTRCNVSMRASGACKIPVQSLLNRLIACDYFHGWNIIIARRIRCNKNFAVA